jgi:hypothetical protein
MAGASCCEHLTSNTMVPPGTRDSTSLREQHHLAVREDVLAVAS